MENQPLAERLRPKNLDEYIGQQHFNNLIELAKEYFGLQPSGVEPLPKSGSQRRYYRLFVNGKSFIGVYNDNLNENQLFINFTLHFGAKKLHVPQIFAISKDGLSYIQEDLGRSMLLDFALNKDNTGGLTEEVMHLYRQALVELLRFQFLGGKDLDYSHCLPRPVFDRRSIYWDLNYFKYCFLRLTGLVFDEDALENDFDELLNQVCRVPADFFMFRDFQSRNIMVRDSNIWFIDYQGGRKGALHYDVASLLYDAVVGIPEKQREELLLYYISELQHYISIPSSDFLKDYYNFVLIRLLQAMGAFGLRGLYERKQHFIDSILPAINTIYMLFDSGRIEHNYPELKRIIFDLKHTFTLPVLS